MIFIISYTIILFSSLSPVLWILSLYPSFPGLIAAAVTPIIGFYWYYRTTKNIHSFGAKKVSSPRMAVIWWFVPFFQLWKPYNVTQQIWRASDARVNLIEGTEWKTYYGSRSIKIGWILFLVAIIGNGIIDIYLDIIGGSQFLYTVFEVSDPTLRLFKIIFEFFMLLSLIIFIHIIRTISIKQQLKSRQV